MNTKLWHRILYGNVPKSFYKDNQELLDKTNYVSVRVAYTFATFLCSILVFIAIVYPVVRETLTIYAVLTVIFGVITLAVLIWLPKHLRWTRMFYFVIEILAFAAAIAAGTYFSPNDLAVQFFVLLVVLPLMYIERPIYSICMSLLASICFCIASYIVKEHTGYLIRIDFLNTICCTMISFVFIYYVRNMHLKNLQATMILQVQSERDGLTGVLNKVSTEAACDRYLTLNATQQHCALLILDIDDFKKINDTLGHKQGDALLKKIGFILRSIFREEDIIGRVGGDEFMVLMKNVHDTKIAEIKAEKIINEVSTIFAEYSTEHLGCSIGVAGNEMEGLNFQSMYGRADKALYQAKDQGKGRYIVYATDEGFAENGLPIMLVVDDSEVSRAVLQTCFEGQYNILEAEDGRKALALVDRYAKRLSIILLDLEMPIMNGYEVLKYLKRSDTYRNIPVLIITAHDKNELMALELGADDLITKPYDPLVVKKRVSNAIARK